MFCKNCGKELRESSAFCPACGAKASATPPTLKGKKKQKARKTGRKAPLIALGVAAVVIAAGIGVCAAMELGPFEPKDGVYVITKAAYPQIDAIATNTVDKNGNTVSSYLDCTRIPGNFTRTTFTHNRTYNDEGFVEETSGDICDQVIKAGFYVGDYSRWSNQLGDWQYTTIKRDEAGRLTSLSFNYNPSFSENDAASGNYECLTSSIDCDGSFTYNDNGTMKSAIYHRDCLSMRFDHDGRLESEGNRYQTEIEQSFDQNGLLTHEYERSDFDNDSWYGVEKNYDYLFDNSGRATEVEIKAEYTSYDERPYRQSDAYSFTYNDQGQISSVSINGDTEIQYEYKYIAKPSSEVRFAASNNSVQLSTRAMTLANWDTTL